MKNLVFAALALSATTVHAEVLPTDLCMAQSLPKITFSVMDEGAQERLTRLVEVDANDDGSINFASAYYLAQVADLPVVAPGDLGQMTFVVDRWFPLEYIDGDDAAPAIRIFLRQEALEGPEGKVTNLAPGGAVVFLPRLGHAVSAAEAAEIFVTHVCATRAKLHGAESV